MIDGFSCWGSDGHKPCQQTVQEGIHVQMPQHNSKPEDLHSKSSDRETNNADIAAPAAARVVFTATLAARYPTPPLTFKVDPQLNPYQPNHKMRAPRANRTV